MSCNTIICLPMHVNHTYLLQVMAKVVGQEWAKSSFLVNNIVIKDGRREFISVPRPFDPDLPTSEDNCWHIHFPQRNQELRIDVSSSNDASYGNVIFTDACANPHHWFFQAQTENEDWKTLRPGSHGLAVAVGRRLVKFFGGQLIENDSNDDVSLKVSNARATFPRKLATQSSNDRWFQFYNALHAQPRLTANELGEAIDRRGGNEIHLQLLEHLQRMDFQEHLDANLPQASSARPNPRL